MKKWGVVINVLFFAAQFAAIAVFVDIYLWGKEHSVGMVLQWLIAGLLIGIIFRLLFKFKNG